jgi:PEP-CTERM motif
MHALKQSLIGTALFAISLTGAVSIAHATTYVVSDVDLTGLFGTVSGGGTFSSAGPANLTIDEVQPGATYTYNFQNGNGTGGFDPVKSQQPATPCIIAGCTGTIPSTNAEFDLDFTQPGTVNASFEDNGETYSGTAFVAVSTSVPEPSTWAMMLLGFAAQGFAAYCMPCLTPKAAWNLSKAPDFGAKIAVSYILICARLGWLAV